MRSDGSVKRDPQSFRSSFLTCVPLCQEKSELPHSESFTEPLQSKTVTKNYMHYFRVLSNYSYSEKIYPSDDDLPSNRDDTASSGGGNPTEQKVAFHGSQSSQPEPNDELKKAKEIQDEIKAKEKQELSKKKEEDAYSSIKETPKVEVKEEKEAGKKSEDEKKTSEEHKENEASVKAAKGLDKTCKLP